MTNRIKYTIQDIKNNSFYQLPKFLFDDEFSELSNDAKLLYALLRDRHELSVKNHWVNDKNEVYLIYSREDMAKMLNVTQPTLRKSINQLKDFGLMEEQRVGLNKPNKIYLTTVGSSKNIKKQENIKDDKKILSPNDKNLYFEQSNNYNQYDNIVTPNNTNINNTNISDTESVSQSVNEQTERLKKEDIFNPNNIMSFFKNKINYEFLKNNMNINIHLVDELLLNIIDMYYAEYISVNGVLKNRNVIQSILMKIDEYVIQYILQKYSNINYEIKNKKNFVQSLIYNSILEINFDYTNQYKSEFYQE